MANSVGHKTNGEQDGGSPAWAGMNAFLLVMMLLLCAYLLYSLIRPEKF